MAIDASIYGNIKTPEAVNPLAQYAQMQQIEGLQKQGRLADLAYGEKEREVSDGRAMDAAYKAATGANGTIDRNALFSEIAKTQGRKLPGIQKGFADQDKAAADAQKGKLEAGLKHFEAIGQIMSGVVDQPTYDRARQQAAQLFGPEAAANLPPVFNAEEIANRQKQAMTIKDQLEQEYKKLTFGETQRHNQATERLTGQGQILTDTRARDLNAIKQEDVKLKRDAKDETANLTKNSQIASFDTMLGTLDRLSKHPGLERSVGGMGALPTMPGSPSANFQAELNTFQSQAFIPMVAQLKGMGALSDAEGKKLTAAVGALDKSMSKEAFSESLDRIVKDMTAARARLVGGEKAPPAGASGTTGSWDAAKPMTVTNAADYAKIPSGATYTSPDGKLRKKP